MNQMSLPAVAKSFYTFCKKCDADRYHRVLTHTSSTSAKIECEVCKSKKSYSLPKTGSSSTTAKRLAGKSSDPSTSKRSSSVSARSHAGQYELFTQNKASVEATPFSIKTKFNENQKINHPKFGVGFVVKSFSDKIEVIFSDEMRTLMHARN